MTPTVTLFCHSFWHLIWKYICHVFSMLAFYLTFFLASLVAFYLEFYSGILSDIHSDILSGIYSDILSYILSGILSGMCSDILSAILSGILSGVHSGILCGIYSDILSGIVSGVHSGNLSDMCPDPRPLDSLPEHEWCGTGSRASPQHPKLGLRHRMALGLGPWVQGHSTLWSGARSWGPAVPNWDLELPVKVRTEEGGKEEGSRRKRRSKWLS